MDVVINSDYPFSQPTLQPIKRSLNYYQQILMCFGYPPDNPPVADLLRLYHELEGHWLVVSPTVWQATHNDVILQACSQQDGLTEVASRYLFDLFSTSAAAEGMQTVYHDADTWLLQCDDKPLISSLSVDALQNQSLFEHIKSLDNTLFWQRFITEIQMLFSSNKMNGQIATPVNGIWIWGAGQLDKLCDKLVLISSQKEEVLAKHLSTKIKMLSNKTISKHALILFEFTDENTLLELEHELRRYAVNWYWSNVAYHSKSTFRFLRHIFLKRAK